MSIIKKKICLVIHSLQAGGMERVMSELARYFASKNEVELHLVLFGITREVFYPVPESIFIHKPFFAFDKNNRFLSTIKTLSYLRKEIKKIDPDTVLSFGEYWNNFVLLSMFGSKYPIYISDRAQPDKSIGKVHDTLRRWLYPTATGVVLQTEKAKDIYLKKNRHKNIAVIGNPIREIKCNSSSVVKENYVLMVGRLIRSKNQDMLIELFARINKPDWKLVLVGYDHLKQKNMDGLKKLSKELGVEDKVIFKGKVNNTDEIYCKSSIFAFTSSSEGFPNVIGEAMSAGLPVVAFDCVAGPSEMIRDGENGFLVPLFDTASFQEKLSLLMEDEKLRNRMGQQAKQDISRFSIDTIGERFFEFITQ